jgi:hypothetical protein
MKTSQLLWVSEQPETQTTSIVPPTFLLLQFANHLYSVLALAAAVPVPPPPSAASATAPGWPVPGGGATLPSAPAAAPASGGLQFGAEGEYVGDVGLRV